jgi:hypothetical protein
MKEQGQPSLRLFSSASAPERLHFIRAAYPGQNAAIPVPWRQIVRGRCEALRPTSVNIQPQHTLIGGSIRREKEDLIELRSEDFAPIDESDEGGRRHSIDRDE